jgi:hypothetical protein
VDTKQAISSTDGFNICNEYSLKLEDKISSIIIRPKTKSRLQFHIKNTKNHRISMTFWGISVLFGRSPMKQKNTCYFSDNIFRFIGTGLGNFLNVGSKVDASTETLRLL